jgi:thiosulfate/3-mercaptopyruvate sulfurtransferase
VVVNNEDERFGPLVGAEWLLRHLDDGDLRIADCRWYLDDPPRGRAEYESGHIPGSVYVSLDDDLTATEGPGRHPLAPPDAFAERFAGLGFGDAHRIVAYDTAGGAIAARMWWMLAGIGHGNVAVLDGGAAAWQGAGGELVPGADRYPATTLTVNAQPITIDSGTLERRLGSVTLIDARDGDRYRGEREPIDPVAGHIPTAINLPYKGNLQPDDHFSPPDALRARFAAAGAASGETIVYCGSGVTACHDILAMEIAGLPAPTLYPGSWSDWGESGRAVATGAAPGTC